MSSRTAGPVPSPDDIRLLDPNGSFRDRLAADRNAIARLLEEGNDSALVPIVHRLAGAAGTFGFPEIGRIALDLDDAAASGHRLDRNGLAALLAALDAACQKSG